METASTIPGAGRRRFPPDATVEADESFSVMLHRILDKQGRSVDIDAYGT
jgi:hypothetical protein